MYVNPFLFGVFVTVLVETVGLLLLALWYGGKRRR